MERWWEDVEREVLACLGSQGPTAPAVLARRLRMSEDSVVSLLAALAREGRIRICLVDRAPETWLQARASDAAALPPRTPVFTPPSA